MSISSDNLKIKIINGIIEIEGGYVNNLDDSGGETNFGITLEVARDNGYYGSMKDMPHEVAFDIYAHKYWLPVHADDLSDVSIALAEEVVDTAVNMGVPRASGFLQRALNTLNNRGELYPDIEVDTHIGNATIGALRAYADKRNIEVLVKMLNCMQGAFYVDLAERREKDEEFIYGWFKNRVVL